MTSAFPSDLTELLVAFEVHNVEYLLVGGQAVALHGHARFTKDSDNWLRNKDEDEHVQRAQQALADFGAPESVVAGVAPAKGLGRTQNLAEASSTYSPNESPKRKKANDTGSTGHRSSVESSTSM